MQVPQEALRQAQGLLTGAIAPARDGGLAAFLADSNVVDRHIRNLRIKLQNDWRRPRYIATVPGRGYRFVPTAEEAPAPVTAP